MPEIKSKVIYHAHITKTSENVYFDGSNISWVLTKKSRMTENSIIKLAPSAARSELVGNHNWSRVDHKNILSSGRKPCSEDQMLSSTIHIEQRI